MPQAELRTAVDELKMRPQGGQGRAPQPEYAAELERVADLHPWVSQAI